MREIRAGNKVAVADVAYGNGGDLKLAALLENAGISLDVLTYGGWNTSGNTLGTVISAAALSAVFGKTEGMKRSLLRGRGLLRAQPSVCGEPTERIRLRIPQSRR